MGRKQQKSTNELAGELDVAIDELTIAAGRTLEVSHAIVAEDRREQQALRRRRNSGLSRPN